MSFKVSNETKVGALAAVAITFLVLGYNFLSGRGSLFSKSHVLCAILPDVTGINTSTPVLFNGYKVGNVTEIEMNKAEDNFKVMFDISEDIEIPIQSSIKVVGELLGGKTLLLIKSHQKELAANGSTLLTIKDTTLMESVGLVVKPLSSKIKSIINSLDSLLAGHQINTTISTMNTSLKSLTRTSDNASLLIEQSLPKLTGIINNVESITSNLKEHNQQIGKIIDNLKTTTDNLAASNLKEAVDNANKSLLEVTAIMTKINNGEGTLGLLVNDTALYNNLNKSAVDLDIILKDLNKHPDKYVPVPFTKKQRKKAMKASEADNIPK